MQGQFDAYSSPGGGVRGITGRAVGDHRGSESGHLRRFTALSV